MKTRCRTLLQSLALFLGVVLMVSPVAFAATGSLSGADEVAKLSVLNVEDKVDCTISYLRVEMEMEVPDDFKTSTGFMTEVEARADADGMIAMDTADPNMAANNVIKDVCDSLLTRTVAYESIIVAIRDNVDNVSADYCEMWEAYEEDLEPGAEARGGEYETPEYDDPVDEEGWIYYGKAYDRDEITDRATNTNRSTNGVLYLSDDEIQVSSYWRDIFLGTEEYEGGDLAVEDNGYGGYSETWRYEEGFESEVPPLIAPYAVGGYGGYGGYYGDDEDEYGWEYSASGSEIIAEDVMPAPSVEIEPGQYYRYSWNMPVEPNGLKLSQERLVAPDPSFSATLYDNNWILFDYSGDMDYAFWAIAGYDTGVAVGLHPGGIEREEFVSECTDYYDGYGYWLDWESEVLTDICENFGPEDYPGPGSPRSDYYLDNECEMDLSEQYGRPLDDIYDEDGNLAWLPILETFGYFPMDDRMIDAAENGDEFDLADRFILFRDYQMVADYNPELNDGYGGFDNFRREETPHKYTVTTGSRDMVVDRDSLDEAVANVIEDPSLLEDEIDDFWASMPKEDDGEKIVLFDDYEFDHVSYDVVARHGSFKPGEWYYDYPYEGDPDFPGIENWPIEWYGYWENGAEIDAYKYGLQTVGAYGGYGGYGGYNSGVTNFTNWDTLERINSSGFLAYAVQVEEDIVNRKILDMQSMRSVADSVRDAQSTAGIRERDAWYAQNADAQSGRVTKDHQGNWVRAQQYVLRSEDDMSVQVLNATLRSGSDLSTMVFETNFNNAYSGNLTELPWDRWLDTEVFAPEGADEATRLVFTEPDAPELANMSVTFANNGGESLQEVRTFDGQFAPEGGNSVWQEILSDQLVLASLTETNTYDYVLGAPETATEYTIGTWDSGGFTYVLGDEREVDVALYEAYDRGESWADESGAYFKDIWDALRVNSGSGPFIGQRNLEISIDEDGDYFSQAIDVVYIPMTRMLWKGVEGTLD